MVIFLYTSNNKTQMYYYKVLTFNSKYVYFKSEMNMLLYISHIYKQFGIQLKAIKIK